MSGFPARLRVLVTGAGGPAGVAVIRSLANRDDLEVVAADMDRWASGLYLVDASRRRLVPPGAAPGFADAVLRLIVDDDISVVIPTVDVELEPLAAVRPSLERQGVALASPTATALATCLDKLRLAEVCSPVARVPETRTLAEALDPATPPFSFPVILKPRRGAGSRGVQSVESADLLVAAGERIAGEDEGLDDWIVQELLPGDEYSVDVLMAPDGHCVAAVPRLRARVDSGVAVAGRTVNDPELIATAIACAAAAGIDGVANVQLRRAADGRPALLEINPRFSGSMPLTIASGPDMPSLLVDQALGLPVPEHVSFEEIANVRFLEDVFLPLSDVLPAPPEETP